MDKNKELAKNTIIITVGKICTQFMSFFLMPLYTAVLSTEEYGIVDLVITYTSLFIPIILFEVDQALFRFLIDVRNNKSRVREMLSTACIFACGQIIIAACIFYVVQLLIDIPYKWYLLFNVFGAICSNMMLQSTRGLGKNTLYAFGSFLSAFSQIIGNILFLLTFKMGVQGMLVATVVSHFVTAIVIAIRIGLVHYVSIRDFNIKRLKEILKYSLPLIPNQLCWWVLNISDRTIVLMFLGMSFNGLLSVAHKFSSLYITFYNIFNLSWTESASMHMNDSDGEEFISSVITNMFKLFMCAGVGVIAVTPFMFPILINIKFSGAFNVIPVFVLASMFNVIVGLLSVVYVALKKTKEIAKTSFFAGVINIIVHVALVKWLGLFAAAVSTAVAFGTMSLYRYLDLKKYIKIRIPFKYIIVIIGMYAFTLIGYYSNSVLFQCVVLFVDLVVSVVLNKNMLTGMIDILRSKIKR